jgi:hypothetical protein
MAIETGKDTRGCFARWGKRGEKHRYPCGNPAARRAAQQLALRDAEKRPTKKERPE